MDFNELKKNPIFMNNAAKVINYQSKITIDALLRIKQMSKHNLNGIYFHGSNNLFGNIDIDEIQLTNNRTVSSNKIDTAFISPDWEFASCFAMYKALITNKLPYLYIYKIPNIELDLFKLNNISDLQRILKLINNKLLVNRIINDIENSNKESLDIQYTFF